MQFIVWSVMEVCCPVFNNQFYHLTENDFEVVVINFITIQLYITLELLVYL